jgi:hypothetical protein
MLFEIGYLPMNSGPIILKWYSYFHQRMCLSISTLRRMSGMVRLAVLARVGCVQMRHKIFNMDEAPGVKYLSKTVMII